MNSDLTRVEELTVELSTKPYDPVVNFTLGLEYHKYGQLASALGCYLRAAEFGYDTHPDYVYTSLLKIAACAESQKERTATVSGALLQAIGYLPARPEAWFLLARFHERAGNWRECYAFASAGRSLSRLVNTPLPAWVEYPGEFVFDYEMAVSGWWIGRRDDSVRIFNDLLTHKSMPQEYVNSCINNLRTIGA